MIELLIPVGLGLLGSWMGFALARKGRQWRLYALREADRLRQAGKLKAAVVVLEQALQNAGPSEAAFRDEAHYRLVGLYGALGSWRQCEALAQKLLTEKHDLGPTGRHELLRHLAKSLEAQDRRQEHDQVLADADSLIEQIPDTAYRLFARQERLVRLGRHDEALLLQEELLRDHRERISLSSLLVATAATAFNAGYPHEALRYARESLATEETNYLVRREAYRVLLSAYTHTTEWHARAEAAEAFLALAESAKDTKAIADARSHAAHARLLLGNRAGAEELAGDSLPLQVTLARLAGDPAEVERLLSDDPSAGAALIVAGSYLDAGDATTALEWLDTILPTPDRPLWLILRRRARRAWALAALGRADEAQAELDTLPESYPDPETELVCLEARAAAKTILGDPDAKAAFLRHPALAPVFRDFPRLW